MALLMALCCLAPLALILTVTVFGLPFSGVLSFAAVLLCPLMMSGGHGHGGSTDPPTAEPDRVGAKTDIGAW